VSAAVAEPVSARPEPVARSGGVSAVYRMEISKVSAQLLPRLVAVVCLLGPFVFAFIMRSQTSTPADTLFGRWVTSSGFALPFVVLGFAGIAGFPLLTSIVAGDIFASEDRLSTWKTVLTRSSTREEVFWGKTLAAATFTVVIVTLLAVSCLAAGVLVVGTQPLIGLSGALLSPGHAFVLVVEAWAIALIPALAFTALGVLFSVGSRNSLIGVLGPPIVGLLMVLISLLGSGLVLRTLMLTNGFEAWHGLQLDPPKYGPFLFGAVVAAAYAYLCLDAARTILRRRDFAGEGATPLRWSPLVRRSVLIAVAVVAVLAVASRLDPTWITADRLEASVGSTFRNLVAVQQTMQGQPVAASSIGVFPFCKREAVRSGPSRGAGDDWICAFNVNSTRLGQLSLTYRLTVKPDGCYTAEGPESVGPMHVRDAQGRTVVNPLFAFDGCMVTP
jgi:ABC-2 type transport system permease protein